MMGSMLLAGMAALAVLCCVSPVAPALAKDTAPQADVVGEASSPSKKVPIRVKVVDYQKAEDGPGTLKMSGTAVPGREVHIYVDEKRFAKVPAADEDGSWSVEDKIALDEKVHSVRVEQFNETTNMLAGRAMFSMSLGPPSPEDLAAPPAGRR